MNIETFTYIEVENEPNVWAIELHECKNRMKPCDVKFVFVHNGVSNNDVIYVDNTLTDIEPQKIIEGVSGSISKDFTEVGFWRLKK